MGDMERRTQTEQDARAAAGAMSSGPESDEKERAFYNVEKRIRRLSLECSDNRESRRNRVFYTFVNHIHSLQTKMAFIMRQGLYSQLAPHIWILDVIVGKKIQEYKGPCEAHGIVDYLKKQTGLASAENQQKMLAVLSIRKISLLLGCSQNFLGEEFENFTALAEKLRPDYNFGHTLDAKFLPWGESVQNPTLRLLKPFDKLKELDSFQSTYKDVAKQSKGKGISFLLGDLEATVKYFGLKEDQVPLLIIHKPDRQKFFKANIEPTHIAPWLKNYLAYLFFFFLNFELDQPDEDHFKPKSCRYAD
ncbi:Protein disulfide-isomerase [Forsythia ovata]|uniref:protein disulfide-isomerase n=1 Tax=Forsythia ovata TaxID=205694 RepID=A0ABD1USR5_9LAMI